ncbi:tkl protein kinase [Plasmopara halstedii]|uniref:Tkl protein kinase n=1 Tax=Plasmopara halstedii TaxID=4781 RepID=A0A0P1AXA1_PLAHL|nr:tkl protein kinase [Plasmopara halstedii]CEG45809.1 tkl protein kinase [Plasmopara halstedii]|eukprot:XP_024582178.1 tkl protein kinase [Plasmopara halstedii]
MALLLQSVLLQSVLLQSVLLLMLEASANEHFILSVKENPSVLPSGDTLVSLELSSAVPSDLLTTSRVLVPVAFDSFIVKGQWTLGNWSVPLSSMLSSVGGTSHTVQVDVQLTNVGNVTISQLLVQADPTPLESVDLSLSFGSDALDALYNLEVIRVDGIQAAFEDRWLPVGVNLKQLTFDKTTVENFELDKTVLIHEMIIRNSTLSFPTAVLGLEAAVTTLIMEANTISGPIQLTEDKYARLVSISDFRTTENIVNMTEGGMLSCIQKKSVKEFEICIVKDIQGAAPFDHTGSTYTSNTRDAGSLETRSASQPTSTRNGISASGIVIGCAVALVILIVLSFFRRFKRKASKFVDERLPFSNREEDLLANHRSEPDLKIAPIGNSTLVADMDLGKDQVTLHKKLGIQGLWIGEYRDAKVVALKFVPRELDMTIDELNAVRLSYVPLRHENIVTFLGSCWTEREEVLIVVEHMAMGSLRKVLADDSIELAWPQRLQISKDICSGLNFVRSSQGSRLSCNLTARSAFVDAQLRCKLDIFDYALSLRKDLIPVRSYGHGDIACRAPELLKGEEVTAAAEIYALGVIFCEISSRRKLYEHLSEEHGSTMADIIIAIEVVAQRLKPSLAEDAPPDFRELTLQCLSYAPADRPQLSAVLNMFPKY